MRTLDTPSGDGANVVDIFNPGDDFEYALAAGVPLRFPVQADSPDGGAFFIRVPSGSDVRLVTREGSPGYPLDGLGHWPFAFETAEVVVLVSAAGATINVLQHKVRVD